MTNRKTPYTPSSGGLLNDPEYRDAVQRVERDDRVRQVQEQIRVDRRVPGGTRAMSSTERSRLHRARKAK